MRESSGQREASFNRFTRRPRVSITVINPQKHRSRRVQAPPDFGGTTVCTPSYDEAMALRRSAAMMPAQQQIIAMRGRGQSVDARRLNFVES